MMMSEFTQRTGFEPSAEEYAEIEKAYYDFDGNKDAFCAHWVKTVGLEGMLRARGERIEQLRSEMMDVRKTLLKTIAEREARISALDAALEREEEWKPYEDEHNVKQADYDELAGAGGTRELSDDEAAEMVATEFGFDRAKIRIVRETNVEQINRHQRVRRVGKRERRPLFGASDWNYIRFDVKGGCTMSYEMSDGALRMYWD